MHCTECGDTKPLNRNGVCRYRGGCEHRVMQHEMRMERLELAMRAQERQIAAFVEDVEMNF